MARIWSMALDKLVLSVPLLVMAALALGTYWLVRNTPPPAVVEPEPVRGHEPDYYMKQFAIRTYDDKGALRSEITGEVAKHFPDTKWIEIDGIRIRSVDAKGRLSEAQADHGLTDDHANEVQLIGKASVKRQDQASVNAPSIEYHGEFLHVFLKAERIRSHLPVEIRRGNDRFTADTLDYDDVERQLLLKGRVRATLQPQKTTP
ncbi:LPS export ABC transporter periplasmic protein LptC [Curvibacter sp. CHRR-16]|uniref:LPS export ABC transporter periplasmic protein LptC n=1 Tax=Curvibacter sp. CHRR-16 TaxID=2835872 RepID=UPI001BDB18C1|nr:LPS export ABC transporter periplasmic protein LptC [Curvibacter sp. CHRR-16]MBT0570332.1 LPS export ABC transporter periplasmic protein LptC [Curvibacter sp. CHRR-16]